jgi:alkylhydroperoxidase family enzyme
MALLTEIDPKDATGQTKALFDRLERAVGRVPTMIRLMGASPAVLDAYLHFNHALEQTTLSPKTRALITVAIAELNGCDYTLSLGMALGKRQGYPRTNSTRRDPDVPTTRRRATRWSLRPTSCAAPGECRARTSSVYSTMGFPARKSSTSSPRWH